MNDRKAMQEDTWSCFACVAAMITGETLQDVVEFVGHDGSGYLADSRHPEKRAGFGLGDIAPYLFSRNFMLGCFFAWDPAEMISRGERYIEVRYDIRSCPALVVVESHELGEGVTHCLYWDGKRLHDPKDPGPVRMEDYQVVEWWPVWRLED